MLQLQFNNRVALSSCNRPLYLSAPLAGDVSKAAVGLQTGDNDKFMRFWYEVSWNNINCSFLSTDHTEGSSTKWVPYNKGGSYRKWYGNREYVVNWKNNGEDIKAIKPKSVVRSPQLYFKESITWSEITSSWKSFRLNPKGSISDVKGQSAYFKSESELFRALCWLNSNITEYLTKVLNPTLSFQSGDYKSLPMPSLGSEFEIYARNAVEITKNDWDSIEISFDFKTNSLMSFGSSLAESYLEHSNASKKNTSTLFQIEESLNKKLADKYTTKNDVRTEVFEEQVTLFSNPKYRYGTNASDEELNNRFRSDTDCELISYAIGCILGRYSLDREGLVYAHAGNQGFAELAAEGAYKSFPADDDGILPLTDQEWFSDDATNRFREFVRTVWAGPEGATAQEQSQLLQENLNFVAASLCLHAIKAKSGESALDTIRRYLSTQFYKDHLKTYKKRPIYWLFSSGKHKAFECLVYLHRYNEGTLARMRTEYVIPLTAKLSTYANKLEQDIDASTSTAEKKALEKQLVTLHNQQAELATFDEKLRHHADLRITLDLDEGVKVNYGKFGDLLAEVKAVTGDKAE